MQRKQTIIEELMNMGSLLHEHQPAQIYQVPKGYFDNLPNLLLFKISAEEETDKFTLPDTYKVSTEYFDSFPSKMIDIVKAGEEVSVSEELSSLSPLLGSIKKETPYTVKDNYFDNLTSLPVNEPVKKQEA